jgi:hypothetical protein
MPESLVRLKRMTLATTRTAEMVKFYNTLFDTGLQPTEAFRTMLYQGILADVQLVICPNEIAGVNAEQSRHQLTLRVDDLSAILSPEGPVGGIIEAPAPDTLANAILRDPHSNTIEVVQA